MLLVGLLCPFSSMVEPNILTSFDYNYLFMSLCSCWIYCKHHAGPHSHLCVPLGVKGAAAAHVLSQ